MAEPARSIRREPVEVPIAGNERPLHIEQAFDPAPLRQAYRTLQIGFTVAPVVAGINKFFHLLVNWDQYLAPQIPQTLGIDGGSFMLGVGLVEVIAGIGIALKPRIFGYVVCAWLLGIIANLFMQGEYYDVALRDLGLAMGAFALARLSVFFDQRAVVRAS